MRSPLGSLHRAFPWRTVVIGMTTKNELDPRWNLDRLYLAPDDPTIDQDLAEARRLGDVVRERYQGRVETLTPGEILEIIEAIDLQSGLLNKVFGYSYLLFSADSLDDANKNLYAKVQREVPEIKSESMFFELEVQRMPEPAFEALLAAPELDEYVDHLGRMRRVSSHALDEFAERIISLKDSTGAQSWTQLYFETTADFRLRLGLDNQPEEMTLSQAYAMRESQNRDERKAAHDATLKAHSEHHRPLTFVFNSLFANHSHMMDLRHYDHPLAPLLIEENLPPSVIETLMETVENSYHLVHRYYRAKARVLGIDDFAGHDLRAQFPSSASFIPFEEGRDIVLDSIQSFSPRLGNIARGFFEDRYIDALSRPGKRAGAYCLSSGPTFHPFIFLNYNFTLKDVIVMAHEMGHGVHNVVGGYHNSLTNADRVTMFMETPSTFFETLTFNRLLALEVNPQTRQQLLGSQIEAAYLKIFKPVALTRFQLNAYDLRKERILPSGEYCRLWAEQLIYLFGDSVSTAEWDHWEWITFHHTLNLPFYDYAYSFGQLLVYALFKRYLEEGPGFEPYYYELLKSGTSITAGPLLKKVDMDLTDPNFWQLGLDYFESMVEEFEATIQD